ncbi:hypothetical protein CMQ_5473 [Grosmannia clavigera kw1407]|uniref:DUF7357 domain-containing protein n=1 Tax=Grosmannia clavigera (strain kw1407 / UAMH 11150) TaxID=655863 RepID=F0XRM3_GROCL|nr:uncharacterized protein CMQ_5473 [Grosmannia clavigera kw1407]EFW99662.1 hypothetical protein CMQ_5473 [Grosmannia clavigera kw1407]
MGEGVLRLRLRIRRHGLPETRIVFVLNIGDDATVSKFLEEVNGIIPLEADDWGLEDYVVELQSSKGTSFECLHFQTVADTLEKDDEVLIRPLSLEEVKKRRLGGRSQISNDGRHLLDGVPFGRPLLKRPRHRPSIHISPRKKRKVTHAFEDLSDAEQTPPLRLDELDKHQGLHNEDFDEDHDEDFVSNSDLDDEGSSADDSGLEPDELQLLQENPSDVGSRCEQVETISNGVVDNDFGAMVETGLAISFCGKDKYLLRQWPRANAASESLVSKSSTSNLCASSDSVSDGSDGSDGNNMDNKNNQSGGNEREDKQICAQTNAVNITPKGGNPMTVENVGSYSEACSSKHAGQLPAYMGYPAAQGIADQRVQKHTVERLGTQNDSALADSPVCEIQGKARTKRRNARRRAKRAMERVREASTAVTMADRAETTTQERMLRPVESDAVQVYLTGSDSSVDNSILKAALPSDTHLPRQDHGSLRLDVDASHRMLSGALDVRNVKEGSDKRTFSTELCNIRPFVMKTPELDLSITELSNMGDFQGLFSHDSRPKHWRERIAYRAVECCDRSVDLSEPPFPFVQRWGKLTRAQRGSGMQLTSNEKEPAEPDGFDELKSIGAENGQGKSGLHDVDPSCRVAIQPPPKEDILERKIDFPRLPSDTSKLRQLSPGEISTGMVITWKRWALSKKTNWQPQVVDVTALVIDIRNEATILEVLLSQQDRKFEEEEKVYDEETGQRLYDRFEVPEADDGEERASIDEGMQMRNDHTIAQA